MGTIRYLFWTLVGMIGVIMVCIETNNFILQICYKLFGVVLFIANAVELLKLIKK